MLGGTLTWMPTKSLNELAEARLLAIQEHAKTHREEGEATPRLDASVATKAGQRFRLRSTTRALSRRIADGGLPAWAEQVLKNEMNPWSSSAHAPSWLKALNREQVIPRDARAAQRFVSDSMANAAVELMTFVAIVKQQGVALEPATGSTLGRFVDGADETLWDAYSEIQRQRTTDDPYISPSAFGVQRIYENEPSQFRDKFLDAARELRTALEIVNSGGYDAARMASKAITELTASTKGLTK